MDVGFGWGLGFDGVGCCVLVLDHCREGLRMSCVDMCVVVDIELDVDWSLEIVGRRGM